MPQSNSTTPPRTRVRERVRSRPTETTTELSEQSPVGYKSPPVHTRFQPGKSGNPSGRPKRKKTALEYARKVVLKKVGIRENGKRRKVPAIEALFTQLMTNALQGDGKSISHLMRLLPKLDLAMQAANDRSAASAPTVTVSDDEVLEMFASMIREGEQAETAREGDAQ